MLRDVVDLGTGSSARALGLRVPGRRQDGHHQRVQGRLVRGLLDRRWWRACGSASTSRRPSATTPTARAWRCPSGPTSCGAPRACCPPQEFEPPVGAGGGRAVPHLVPAAGRRMPDLHRVLQGGRRAAARAGARCTAGRFKQDRAGRASTGCSAPGPAAQAHLRLKRRTPCRSTATANGLRIELSARGGAPAAARAGAGVLHRHAVGGAGGDRWPSARGRWTRCRPRDRPRARGQGVRTRGGARGHGVPAAARERSRPGRRGIHLVRGEGRLARRGAAARLPLV